MINRSIYKIFPSETLLQIYNADIMSFIIQNTIDKAYINRINQETRILKSSKLDWDIEDVTRFASLLKI